jgi:hypothetical protein
MFTTTLGLHGVKAHNFSHFWVEIGKKTMDSGNITVNVTMFATMQKPATVYLYSVLYMNFIQVIYKNIKHVYLQVSL